MQAVLAGRAEELSRVDDALRRVEAGTAQVLAISGEPGIGKTRLLAELAAQADGRGHTVLAGHSTELEREAPFAALVEALDDFLTALGGRRLEALGARLPHLADIFAALGAVAEAHSGPAAERYRHHRAFRALLEELAAERPLALVLDDVHWADAASLEAIAHLLRKPPTAPVLLVLSYRTGRIPPILVEALGACTASGEPERLTLGALSEEEAAPLLAEEPDQRRRQWIYGQSGGNPFYIEQLLRYPAPPEAPMAADSMHGASAGPPLPSAVVAAIHEELRHLGPEARRMLEGAAVAGEPFEPEVGAEAAGLPPERALELLDELVARDCVRPEAVPRRFRFRHPIVRRAVYESIPPGRRLDGHRRVAGALAELGAPATARAHHIAISARPGDEAAITLLSTAASQVTSTAPASAAEWLAIALSLLPAERADRRLGLLGPLAQAQAAAGSLPDAHRTLVEITAALPPGTGTGWSQVVAMLASVELHLGRHSGARRRLEGALAALPDPAAPDALPLLIELAVDAGYRGELQRAAQWGGRALEVANDAGDPALRAATLSVLAVTLDMAGEIEAANRHCTEAAAELEALTDEQVAVRLDLPYHLGIGELFLERFEDGVQHLERGVSIALACGNAQFIVPTRTFLAYGLLWLGRLDDATRVAEEAVETGRLLRTPAGIAWALAIGASAWSPIDARESLRLGEQALEVLGEVDDNIISIASRAHVAWACANAGEHGRCIEEMALAGAPDFERFEPGRRCHWAEALTRSMLALGRGDEAREWAARGEEFAAGLGLPVAEAASRRARGLVLLSEGEADSAAAVALEAAQAASEGGAPIEAARSRIVAGRALGAAGERERAVEELASARAELARYGARRHVQEAARELRALGAAAPAPVARRAGDAGTADLSKREREIADLVAKGKSNPEIARALYLSPKTIEGNMRRIFQKLDVSSRAEVAAAIAREGATG